ncbi:DNA/RNA non-specific endonuclease [Bremerella alba]|uniref:Type VII secretion system protein EssD-like domain-containing protein n=1 Tax=Bremerella alba TaxID=980252 RepID=A0A7V8V7I5_9BACT|nr:DNA/RNA non-specific endonuclease [Bremerella alba]MBA2116340.1 hypothetical protein [Bremerella alba]
MAPTIFTKTAGRSAEAVQSGTMVRRGTNDPRPTGRGPDHPDAPDRELTELRDIGLDLLQLALDLAGIVDPTPVSDGASALLALGRGNWLDALISGASMVPYVGDLAKAGKLPRYLRSVNKAIDLAERSQKAAVALMPGIKKLKEVLDLIPTGANTYIDQMKHRVDRFVKSGAVGLKHLPDISGRFKFRKRETVDKIYQEASGRLGVPGTVKKHRSRSEQRKISSGTGDDAGHLIGDRFGAPGDGRNLTAQHRYMNQNGTFRKLEDEWAEKLKNGTGVEVHITDVTRKGEDRPFMRKAEWTEIAPDGSETKRDLVFMNATSPTSRAKRGTPPTVDSPQSGNVINYDFKNRRRLD